MGTELLGLLLIVGIYGLVRNEWVYYHQTKLNNFWFEQAGKQLDLAKKAIAIGDHFEADLRIKQSRKWQDYVDEYESYHMMFLKFWIWDVEKFRIKPAPEGRLPI